MLALWSELEQITTCSGRKVLIPPTSSCCWRMGLYLGMLSLSDTRPSFLYCCFPMRPRSFVSQPALVYELIDEIYIVNSLSFILALKEIAKQIYGLSDFKSTGNTSSENVLILCLDFHVGDYKRQLHEECVHKNMSVNSKYHQIMPCFSYSYFKSFCRSFQILSVSRLPLN